MVGLCAVDPSFLNRERISRPAIPRPRFEIKVSARWNFIDADSLECERLPGFANIGTASGPKKVCPVAASHYGALAIRIDQHRRLLVNRNFTRKVRPSILNNTRQKSQSAAHAVTLGEMRIGQQVLQMRNL